VNEILLSIRNLNAMYNAGSNRSIHAIRDLNIDVLRGEVLALVGESGSGKSTMGLSILRLIEPPHEIKGNITFNGVDEQISVFDLDPYKIREFRWKKVAMVFQSAMNILNPVMRVEAQFIDTFEAHGIIDDYDKRINHYLELAGLGKKVRRLYPHELSGGMKQRVNIALALSCEPELLIADEPTTALDVVVQREVLYELRRLKEELNLTIIFITHDLSVASSIADRIAVFYAGRIVEINKKDEITNNPMHPYSKLLLSTAITLKTNKDSVLTQLEGTPPDLSVEIKGCSFYPRCPVRENACKSFTPNDQAKGEWVECIKPGAMNLKEVDNPRGERR
jgi:oligopeptide/dipeptide ABC transporter ATP-binding protein